MKDKPQKIVLTGIRTTGRLHLGHYVGAMKQWKEIQDKGEYENFYLLADVQSLTTHIGQPEELTESVHQVALDWLSVGLDPTLPNTYFVQQSQVPSRYELSALLMMVSLYNDVMGNPTLKQELERQKEATMGFMAYPVDQAADIYMVSPQKPGRYDHLLVPVGEDQVPHLELSKRIARRFNRLYGNGEQILLPCEELVGEVGRLPGIEGKSKMSKSMDNAIYLSDSAEVVARKVQRMYTDPNRISPDIPGETIENPVFVYHRAFNPNVDEVKELTERYQQGKVTDREVKEKLTIALNGFLDPIRERRAKYEQQSIREYIEEGSREANRRCELVLAQVRERMHLSLPK